MEQQWTELTTQLIALTDLHEELLAEADAKRQSIIDGDIDAMEIVLAKEIALVQAVEAAETARQAVVETLRAELAINEEPVKLAMLIERAPEDVGKKLAAVHARLQEILKKLRYRNRQNQELLRVSMAHVDQFMRAVTRACTLSPGYGRDGRIQGTSINLLDRSA